MLRNAHMVRSRNSGTHSRILGCLQYAADLWPLGVASVSDVWTSCDGDEFWAPRTGFNRSSVSTSNTLDSFLAWGTPPLAFTPGGVRKVLATFLACRYRTPEQYVSAARRHHTSSPGSTFGRASAAVGQPRRRRHSRVNPCPMSLRSGWTRRSLKAHRGTCHPRDYLTTIVAPQRGCHLRRNSTHTRLAKLVLAFVVASTRSASLCVRTTSWCNALHSWLPSLGLASTLFSAICRCFRPATVIRCSSIRASLLTVRFWSDLEPHQRCLTASGKLVSDLVFMFVVSEPRGTVLSTVVRSVGLQAIARYIPNSPLHKRADFCSSYTPSVLSRPGPSTCCRTVQRFSRCHTRRGLTCCCCSNLASTYR